MTVLFLDFETACEIDLRSRGLDIYSADPSCRVLMLAWAVDEAPPKLWLPHLNPELPAELHRLLADDTVICKAWNAAFERTIFRRVLQIDIPPSRWRCSMVRAYMLALPGSLDDCGKVLRLGDEFQKSAEGKRLIRIFCVPHAETKKHPYRWYNWDTHPTEWSQFCAYCLQDVVSERKIDNLLARFPVPETEWKLYALDQKINDRGIHIDLPFVENAIKFMDRRKREIGGDLKRLTGLANPNSTAQLLPWARERGYPFDSLGKERVIKALTDFELNMRSECVQALRLRLTAAKTSVLKFRKIMQLVGADGRLRFTLQMAGAGRTLRWAGRGVQVQNLPRCRKDYEPFLADIRRMVVEGDYESLVTFFGDPIDVLTSSVRTALSAAPGNTLVASDLNAIETRLAGWISGCESLAQVFATGRCPYKTFAALALGKPYDEITAAERQLFKPAVLGCWFMLSGGAEVGKYPETIKTGLWAYAEAMGIRISKEDAHRQVDAFRSTYPEAVEMWAALTHGAMEALQTRQPQKVGPVTFDVMAPFLRMHLPSGRYIYYLRPQIGDHVIKHPGGEFVKRGVSYEGKNKLGAWTRVNTHGGKLVENICQAVARDILCEGLLEADARGFNIVMHCHDEIVAEESQGCGEQQIAELEHSMALVPEWAPGLMLAAKGFSSPFYKKD